MKKILLASSALVFVGGFAYADATVTGSAELGIFGGEDALDAETQYHSDINVDFALDGETDGGVAFGAEIGLEEAQDGVATTAEDDFTVFLSSDFGTLTMGDTDGGFDWAMQDTNFGMAGSIIDNEEHLGFNGMNNLDGVYDGQIARYNHTIAGFGFAVSAELDDTGESDPMLGIGGKYTFDLSGGSVAVGAGYQGAEDTYLAGLTVGASLGDFSVGGAYFTGEAGGPGITGTGDDREIDFDVTADVNDVTYYGVSAGYSFGAATVSANYGLHELEAGDASGYGVTAAYDLGGGLELQAGYGYSEIDADSGDDLEGSTYSFGVAMSF